MVDTSPKTFTVPKDVTELKRLHNVSGCEVVCFEAGTSIEVLQARSFGRFTSLKTIFIPPSVKVIAHDCFLPLLGHSRLESAIFEPGSE
jgi:hypothetical protein